MKFLAVVALVVAAGSASAQDFGLAGRDVSVELGLGAQGRPVYPGSDDTDAAPWLIWQNFQIGTGGNPQGFSFSPSFSSIGERDPSDDDALAGMDQIDRAYELGGKVSYGQGPVTAYGTIRRGFGGHEGVVGELGTTYRTDLSDRVTLWSGVEFGWGNSEYSDTYFGVTPAESVTSGYPEYAPGSGFNSAAIKFRARYALNDRTAIMGEVEYGRLIGDAADSPIVEDKYQPALRLGIVRKFSFGF
ncbi:MipA/OmpV family protein [Paracoccus sp. R12_1]|uniref:MipA/OmpV family protein n=1 Tax=unclassified Paracoccus (in: a-proteobacteria) TaxID=2688777 RepID=UPI001ADB6B22|nr:MULTISPECIES: MipA/OmpV family protein [unclassified Paracoccus (in: a-proteobacteria)]MBO9455891.1 MipA/OmpV family protein [Paracoccus sp. R12_2]MBO9486693.1 MipA/OmpV family protein [Paracoccus sp. R12_1]